MRLAALVLASLLALAGAPVAAQEVFVRDVADAWGQRIAARLGIPGFGQSIAVIVAVGDYRNGWPPLEAPARDAERMRDFLAEEAGFDRIYTFIDGEATYDALRKLMLDELPGLVGSDDRLLFYFSGHGTQRTLFGDRVAGYLPLRDSTREGWSTMIAMDDLERWWAASAHARQSLFILDACFSGLGLQSKSGDLRRRTLDELRRRGHHIITAGTEDQESYASISRWGGSLFTTALIDGMRGYADTSTRDMPTDGIVSLKEIWEYVGTRIRSEVPPNTMTPQLSGFEFSSPGEFFFIATDALPARDDGAGPIEQKGGAVELASAVDPGALAAFDRRAELDVGAAIQRPEAGVELQVGGMQPAKREDRFALYRAEERGAAEGSRRDAASFRDCPVCPDVVVVPPGEFEMGSDFGPDVEKPRHRVEIPSTFAMGRTEVTVDQWRACVSEGGCVARGGGDGSDPVTAVSWDEVQTFLTWLSRRTGKAYRLPTEAEWEYAARGGDRLRYPTGPVLLAQDANYGGRQDGPSSVGSYPANPFDLHDLAGNVWEWVADCAAPYADRGAATSAGRGDCTGVLRGGSWRSDERELLSANRFFYPRVGARADFGFRVARDYSP